MKRRDFLRTAAALSSMPMVSHVEAMGALAPGDALIVHTKECSCGQAARIREQLKALFPDNRVIVVLPAVQRIEVWKHGSRC